MSDLINVTIEKYVQSAVELRILATHRLSRHPYLAREIINARDSLCSEKRIKL